jgi:hypothetical protein
MDVMIDSAATPTAMAINERVMQELDMEPPGRICWLSIARARPARPGAHGTSCTFFAGMLDTLNADVMSNRVNTRRG